MEENFMNAPVVDYDECFEFIEEKTGISRKTIEKVIDAETEYLISLGIITTERNDA